MSSESDLPGANAALGSLASPTNTPLGTYTIHVLLDGKEVASKHVDLK